jgi:hypothetical protein
VPRQAQQISVNVDCNDMSRNLRDLHCKPTIARTEIDRVDVRFYAGCRNNAGRVGPKGLPPPGCRHFRSLKESRWPVYHALASQRSNPRSTLPDVSRVTEMCRASFSPIEWPSCVPDLMLELGVSTLLATAAQFDDRQPRASRFGGWLFRHRNIVRWVNIQLTSHQPSCSGLPQFGPINAVY